MESQGFEQASPFVRFIRWDNRPLDSEPFSVDVATAHTFVVSLHPAADAPGCVAAAAIKIDDGDIQVIRIRKIGNNARGGQLWRGTIPAESLEEDSAFLIRIVDNRHMSACEVEIKTKTIA